MQNQPHILCIHFATQQKKSIILQTIHSNKYKNEQAFHSFGA